LSWCKNFEKLLFAGKPREFPFTTSSICNGIGPLVNPFRSHVSRSPFKGLPWFLLPVAE